MKPKDNGLANLHDRKREERGFCCMKLITFLTADGVKEWDEWHGEHLNAARANANTGHDAWFTGVVKTGQNRTNKYRNE